MRYIKAIPFIFLFVLYNASRDKVSIAECSIEDTVSIKRATVYNAVVAQCDEDPFTTADGSKIDVAKLESGKLRWIALSQDLVNDSYKASLHPGLFKGKFKFGDTLRVKSLKHSFMNGLWVVKDVMNKRYRKSMDFLIPLKGRKLLGRDFKICKK